MTKAPIALQELRRRIYRKAKSEKAHRFWGIFVHVTRTETLEEAVQRKSLPLFARIDIALRRISDRGDTPEARWARETIEKTINPAFKLFPPLH